jgi:D-alanyl-D-alanine carboxypeptidase
MAAMKQAEFRRIVAMDGVALPGWGARGPRTLKSTDRKLGPAARVLGIKTGYTNDAKFCLVAAAERNRTPYTVVILGAPNSQVRFQETAKLLDWAMKNFTYKTVATPGETVHEIPVAANGGRAIPLAFAQTATAPVFGPGGEVVREIVAAPAVDLPVFEGQQLGEVRLKQAGGLLATVPLVATEGIASTEETVGSVPVTGYAGRSVTARAAAQSPDVPKFDPTAAIERTVRLASSVRAPVERGEQIGLITYAVDGRVILEVPAVAAETVGAPGALQRTGAWFVRTWEWMTGNASTTQAGLASSREWTAQPAVR